MGTTLTPTSEQTEIIDAIRSGGNLKIEAAAGSGKTSTLRMACEVTTGDILYLAFNKEAQKAAERSFPKANVECRTLHSLGWHGEHHSGEKLGKVYEDRLFKRVPAYQTANLMGIQHDKLDLGGSIVFDGKTIARLASETIDRFCHDSAMLPQTHHVPTLEGLPEDQNDYLRSEILPYARKLWQQTQRVDSAHRFTPDMYLKMWSLGNSTFLPYDVILLDEAQDSNNLTKKLITSQPAQLVAVGDRCQQLYGWRGARNILDEWPADTVLRLTKSFRFGKAIAEEANVWLPLAGADYEITGNEAMDSRVVTRLKGTNPTAVLCRTNAVAMGRAMDYLAKNLNVAMAGGTTQLAALIQAADDLKSGKRTSHPDLMAFPNWGELMAYTHEPQGKDLGVLVNLVEKYGTTVLIQACKKMVSPSKAQLTVSTGHKAKGLEWDHVEIAEDFREPAPIEDPRTGKEKPGPVSRTEAMLAYVAVTRGRSILDNAGLAWVHDRASTTWEWKRRQDALKR